MKVSVLFFGATADLAGERKVESAVSETAVVADVIENVTARYPKLKHHTLLFAVNEEYVAEDTKLRDGDEVAIFSPVSGG